MIYTGINNFYLTDDQLENSPSRKDGINKATETMLRMYGCDLIQESAILLNLPQPVTTTAQVLFHRFYCMKSLARFDVKKVASSCIWLASKVEENPRKSSQVLIIFQIIECKRRNLPVQLSDLNSLKEELIITERHILKELGFVCHVEHPHRLMAIYLDALGTSEEVKREAWKMVNDSLRTTLCVRVKSEVVACGVIFAAARRFGFSLAENPPWWEDFGVDKSGIDEFCRVLANLYSLPREKYNDIK